MNTQKIEIAINQLERVHRDMNDCANRFILKDVIDQLQEQVKLFAIPDVVWQSEQLVCEHSFVWENPNEQDCMKRRCELCGYREAN